MSWRVHYDGQRWEAVEDGGAWGVVKAEGGAGGSVVLTAGDEGAGQYLTAAAAASLGRWLVAYSQYGEQLPAAATEAAKGLGR